MDKDPVSMLEKLLEVLTLQSSEACASVYDCASFVNIALRSTESSICDSCKSCSTTRRQHLIRLPSPLTKDCSLKSGFDAAFSISCRCQGVVKTSITECPPVLILVLKSFDEHGTF